LSEGRRGRREITVLFRYETRTPKQQQHGSRERERRRESGTEERERERSKKIRAVEKRTDAPLSLFVS